MPERIQRKRTKGWRMPDGAVYVGRPTRWGNPYAVVTVRRYGVDGFGVRPWPSPVRMSWPTETEAAAEAVRLFRREAQRPSWADRLAQLRGRDLACWCPLDQPCHADVLLEIANSEPPGPVR